MKKTCEPKIHPNTTSVYCIHIPSTSCTSAFFFLVSAITAPKIAITTATQAVNANGTFELIPDPSDPSFGPTVGDIVGKE